jgi:tetratricopeptide (TPR) repeat protein
VDTGRALSDTAILLELSDDAAAPQPRARARRARARALCYAGRLDEALDVYREAIAIAGDAGDAVEVARARLASMHALGEQGRLDEAIAAGRTARGEALLALDDFLGAEAAFAAALRAFDDAGAELTAAIAEGNLADLAAREGRLQRALEYFERARRRFEADGSTVHLARLLAEQAETKARLGLPEDALQDYGAALARLDRGGLALEAARARCGMGLVLLRLHQPVEARTLLDAAATAFDELGHVTARARVDLVRAELASVRGRAEEARRIATRAASVLAPRPADAAAAHELLARLADRADDRAEAERHVAAGMGVAQRLDLAPLLADLHHTRARIREREGRTGEAVEALELAVRQVERIRGTLQADRFRVAYLGHRSPLYETLVRLLLDAGGDDETARAFQVTERAKSRMLLDQVTAAVGLDDPDDDEEQDAHGRALRARVRRVRAELSGLYSRLADDEPAADGADGTRRWRESVQLRERELDTLESRLGTTRGTTALLARPAVERADPPRADPCRALRAERERAPPAPVDGADAPAHGSARGGRRRPRTSRRSSSSRW